MALGITSGLNLALESFQQVVAMATASEAMVVAAMAVAAKAAAD
jgi:hypothetical protein